MRSDKKKSRQFIDLLRQKANSFFVPIIATFIFLLLLMLLYMGYNYWRSGKEIEKNINNYAQHISENIKSQVDDMVQSSTQTLSHLGFESRVQKYALRTKMEGPEAILEVRDIMIYMSQIPLGYAQISDAFVYFKNSDSIVSTKGYNTPKDYYSFMGAYDFSMEMWQAILKKNHSFEILFATEPNQPIVLLKSSPATRDSDSNVLVGVFISSAQLQNIFRKFSAMEASSAIITDNGKVIAMSDNFPIMEELSAETWSDEMTNDIQKMAYNGKNYLVRIDRSSLNKWNYVTVFPSQLIMEDLENFQYVTIFMLFVLLSVFSLLVFYFRKKSYQPVKTLMANISDMESAQEDSESGNEIQLIHMTINRLQREHRQIEESLQQQYPIIYNNVMVSLLEEVTVGNEVEQRLETIHLQFEHEGFIVLSIHAEQSGEALFLHAKEERALLKTVIINIAEDLFRSIGQIYSVEISWDDLAIIINSPLPKETMEQYAFACAEELLSLLFSLFSVRVTIGMSGYENSVNQFYSMYKLAQEAQARKMLTGVNTVNQLIKEQEYSRNEYFYPTYIEHKLINSVTTGNEEEAMRIIEVVFTKNFEGKQLSTAYLRCLFYDIISTGIKLLGELHTNPGDVFGQEDLEKKLLQCRSVDEARETITLIISKISNYVNENLQQANEPLLDNILHYIENHYQEDSICIASIAEGVKISESYLCNYFKEQQDITVMRYVEQLRLQHVKELLVTTEDTLSKIAEQTGFSNSSVLIRTFKRRMNETPHQYRANRMEFYPPKN